MKKILMAGIILFSLGALHAQTDSSKKNNDTILTRGFYKNYKEYLANAPSIAVNFSTTLITASKEDSTVVGAKFEITDSVDYIGDVWGFCDGKDIFFANSVGFNMKYWKLQCRGPNPYFYYWHKDFLIFPSIGAVIVNVVRATLPPDAEMMFIDKNGMPQSITRTTLKRLFRDDPVLFREFKNVDDYDITESLVIQYLSRYNESKIGKQQNGQ